MAGIDRTKIKNILVRSTNWLGDAVMTTPALGAIRENFPQAKITVLATPLVAELFSPHAAVDEVIVYDRKGRHGGIPGRFRLAAELRGRRFDLAILLQNAIDAAVIALLARIPVRMGFRTDGRGFLLTHGCPLFPGVHELHHVDYYLAMLARFGIVTGRKELNLMVTPAEADRMALRLAEAGIREDDFVVGINPGATFGSAKRWYPDRFAAVARELADRWGAKIVITGGPGETDIAAAIENGLQGRCLNLAGKTDVRGLMALIKRCNFFVTNDSGPMHIAAAFDVPQVAIFGSTDHTTTSPYSLDAKVVRVDFPCAPCLKRECSTDHGCMQAVTPEEVVAAALTLQHRLSPAAGREKKSC